MKRAFAFMLSVIMVLTAAFSVTVYANEENEEIVETTLQETPEEIEEESLEEETTQAEEITQTEETANAEETTEHEAEAPQLVINEEKKADAPLMQSNELRGEADLTVDFSELGKAYQKANAYLLELNSKVAMYNVTSVQNLIDALSVAEVAEYLSADDLSGYTPSDEEAAAALAGDINSAYAALEQVSSGTDLSSYLVAAGAINNLDKDAYSETKSLGSATRIANILVKTSKLSYTDPLNSENVSTVSAFKETATQQNIDDATRTILDALYVSVRVYNVTTSGAVVDASFQNGTSTGEESPYTATYGSNVIAYSDIDDTAWYLDFSSDSVSRSRQFQGYGSSFKAKVFGNINIYAETRGDETPNMVRIHRTYSNIDGKSAIQVMAFVDDSYTLPSAKAIPNYSFSGYIVNNNRDNPLAEGETVSVSGDMEIEAYYTYNSDADYTVVATALENGTGYNDSAEYNEKIELSGGDNAYGWVEDIGEGKYRPFAIGSDISFLVTESTTLEAVTQAEFNSFGFSLPAINMRKSGYITEGTKAIFNGQIVDPSDKIREYGIIVGVAKNGAELDPDNITVENAGSYENYSVIRAKSTRRVGANQFTISINGLAGKTFKYKGYVIYEKTNGEFVTIYTDLY